MKTQLNLANKITLLRIILVPVFFFVNQNKLWSLYSCSYICNSYKH